MEGRRQKELGESSSQCRKNEGSSGELGDSALELEAKTILKELEFGVKLIAIAEKTLQPAKDLIFFNLTTLENNMYSVELTERGWRVAAEQHNSMHGDYKRLDLHTNYYESMQALLTALSPLFREQFAEKLSGKLTKLKKDSWAQ